MLGCRRWQTSGRSGWPKRRQRLSSVSCTQRTPAGLPSGIPGMGEEIESAMQQAPQPGRQSIGRLVYLLPPEFDNSLIYALKVFHDDGVRPGAEGDVGRALSQG